LHHGACVLGYSSEYPLANLVGVGEGKHIVSTMQLKRYDVKVYLPQYVLESDAPLSFFLDHSRLKNRRIPSTWTSHSCAKSTVARPDYCRAWFSPVGQEIGFRYSDLPDIYISAIFQQYMPGKFDATSCPSNREGFKTAW